MNDLIAMILMFIVIPGVTWEVIKDKRREDRGDGDE